MATESVRPDAICVMISSVCLLSLCSKDKLLDNLVLLTATSVDDRGIIKGLISVVSNVFKLNLYKIPSVDNKMQWFSVQDTSLIEKSSLNCRFKLPLPSILPDMHSKVSEKYAE